MYMCTRIKWNWFFRSYSYYTIYVLHTQHTTILYILNTFNGFIFQKRRRKISKRTENRSGQLSKYRHTQTHKQTHTHPPTHVYCVHSICSQLVAEKIALGKRYTIRSNLNWISTFLHYIVIYRCAFIFK